MATPKKTSVSTIDKLSNIENLVVIALSLGGKLVPLVKGAIRGIRQVATGSKEVAYEILVQADDKELAAVDQLSIDDLTAINAELVKAGAKPLPIPPAPAA